MREEFDSEKDAAVRAAVEDVRMEMEMEDMSGEGCEEEVRELRSMLTKAETDRDDVVRAASLGADLTVQIIRETMEEER